MNIKTRFTILGLVFVLSTLVFWAALNMTLLPLKAQQATNFRVFFLEKTMECNKDGVCLAYLYGSSDPGVKIAGVQGTMLYSQNIEVLGLVQDEKCSTDSFHLERVIDFRTGQDPSGMNAAHFALGTTSDDAALIEGNHCLAGVLLQPKGVTTVPEQATLQLSSSDVWKAGGSTTINVASDADPVNITINDTAVIPSITPPVRPSVTPQTSVTPGPTDSTPTIEPTQPTGSCNRKAEGDGNCDDAIDLVDWDMGRSALNGEGGVYDPNNDGLTNALDLSLWISNNDLLSSNTQQ